MFEIDIKKIHDNIDFIDRYIQRTLYPKIHDSLNNTFSTMFNAMNPQSLHLDREVITDKLFSIAPKAYYCRVWDSEGVKLTKPKIKIVGLAVKKSNTPKFFRDKTLHAIELLLDFRFDDLKEYEDNFTKEIRNADVLDLSSNVAVNSISYEYDSSGKLYDYSKGKKLPAPINSRGAIVYNNLLKSKGLDSMKLIEAGDKCKFIFLKKPNPTNSEVLTFLDKNIFKVLGLYDYIDFDTLIEKYYHQILRNVRDPLNLYKKLDFSEW